MKDSYLIAAILIFILCSCASWKKAVITTDEHNDFIENAIYDFLNTSKLINEDDVFSVDIEDVGENIVGISIMGAINKLSPTPENKIGTNKPYFPTMYLLHENKLFYWYDSTHCVTQDIVNVLAKFNQIDSLNVNGIVGIPELINDDSKKGVHYYFCKDNFMKYKKVTTSKAMGYYKTPNLNCEKKVKY